MQEKPLVSVIIPCYNASRWISTTIDSVDKQTYSNIEVVAIDDGSTDNTIEILRSFEDFPIHIIENSQNIGIPATKNKGIDFANGEIIAFLDQDDYWMSRKIEKQVNALMEDDTIAVVYSDMYEIDEDGCPTHYKTSRNPVGDHSFDQFYMGNIPCYNVTKIVKSDVFEKLGMLDTQFYGADDQDLDLRIAKDPNYRFRYVSEPLVLKRTHRKNASDDSLQLLDDLIKLSKKHKANLHDSSLENERLSDLYARRAFRQMKAGNSARAKNDIIKSISSDFLELKPYLLMPAFLLGGLRSTYINFLERIASTLREDNYTASID